MSSSLARKPNRSGPFPEYPAQIYVDEFLKFVKETGKPDTWRFHVSSRPPKNDQVIEVKRFEIPEKLRPEVGKATCPICSPNSPKYYKGSLNWFANEGVLRALGHCCTEKHFGTELNNKRIAEGKRRERVEYANDFLLNTLPRVSALRAEMRKLYEAAVDADKARLSILKRASKGACKSLAKAASSGVLRIEVAGDVTRVNKYGKEVKDREYKTVALYEVYGMGFLKRDTQLQIRAETILTALNNMHACTEEQALDFICAELSTEEDLFQAEKMAKSVLNDMERIRDWINEAKAFFSSKNLQALSEWSQDPRSQSPIVVEYNHVYRARVWIYREGKKTKGDMPIPASLI